MDGARQVMLVLSLFGGSTFIHRKGDAVRCEGAA
jgi:hypothetical protein